MTLFRAQYRPLLKSPLSGAWVRQSPFPPGPDPGPGLAKLALTVEAEIAQPTTTHITEEAATLVTV
jgi:hypothetical protein